MDILPTQVVEDNFTPKQELSHLLPYEATSDKLQIGILRIGSISYPINQGITNIGRHPRCNIILIDKTISKKHAQIESNNGETWICDLNSSNKTKLNSFILRPGRYYELKSGSIIEFGILRAIYSELGSMDKTLIPEISASNCLKIANTVIPRTPDTLVNYSSTSEHETSRIPGTQTEKGDSIFRRPSAPPKSSTSSRKSYLPDSSIQNSTNVSRDSPALPRKENVNEQRVSISDMQKQKSFESQNDSSIDIHDVETQNICLSSCNFKHSEKYQKKDIDKYHTYDTCNVTNIHDIETQHDVDIHNLKTPRKIDVQNASAESDESTSSISSTKTRKVETNVVTQSKKAIVEKDEDSTHSEHFEISRKDSQECLELSIATNFNDECSKPNESHSFLDSTNLLGNLSEQKSISLSNSPVNKNEMSEKSSNKKDIFDVATQINVNTKNTIEKVTQLVDYAFKASMMEDDSDDTDQEGVFLTYLRVDSQDSSRGKSQTKRQSDSGDSDTYDEGHFTVTAAKKKEAAAVFLEVRQNESMENRHDVGSSRHSDNSFEICMQQVNLMDKDSSKDISKETDKPENVTEKSNVNIDTPVQLIEVNEPMCNVVHKDIEDADDLLSTRIIPNMETSTIANLVKDNATHSKEKEEDDVQHNTPMQISVEKVSTCNESSFNDSDQMNPRLEEKYIKNKMVPTQLLTDIKKKKRAMSLQNKKKSKKVKLNDTMERNLNEMVIDVNKDIEGQPKISTQVLTTILESSQSEENSTGLNIDTESRRSNRRNMSRSRVRSKSPATKPEVSPVLTSRKSRRSSLRKATNHNNSQDYFSNLTSTIKRNILVDSQDSVTLSEDAADTKNEVETKSVNEIVNDENIAPAALLKSASENSPSTRLSRTDKELNKLQLVIETTVENSGKGEHICNTSVDVGPSEHSVTMPESDEEDIMSGLPEVHISGTLSHPESSTSSTSTEFILCTRSMKPKFGAKKAETKKKKALKKSTRKSVVRVNTENNAPSKTRKPRSTAILDTFDNLEMSKVPIAMQENNENEINEIRPKRRMSSHKLLQSEPSPPQEEVRRNPFIGANESTCATNQKDIESLSVFQPSKVVLIAKKAEPAGKATRRAPRAVRRSLSSINITESNVVKHFKEDFNEKIFVASKGSKSSTRRVPATRSSSANILGCVTRKDSPVFNSDSSQQSLTNSQESFGSKQLRVMITRLPSGTPTLPLPPNTAVELTTQSISSEAESDKSITAAAERNNSIRSKYNVDDFSAQRGEESQEVEMIMNSWIKEQDINVNVKKQEETNQNAEGVRAKNTRKCGHASASTSQEIIEDTSSVVYEPDNPGFEAPTSKAKRARITRNTTSVGNVAAKESIPKVRRRTVSKETTKRRSKKRTAQKVDAEERNEACILEETMPSEINFSMDMSAMSTLIRSKRNMSTSFTTSSPHKILFTGISKDYTKLLAKLGASQVEDPTKCTVLVTDKVRRTVKFLCALAQAVPIVSVSWLVKSEKAGYFAELDNYVLKDRAAEAKFGFRLKRSLEKAKKHKLLDGYTVVLTPNVAPPLPELKNIINACGGKPLVRPPSKWPEKAVIVSGQEDIVNAKKFLVKAPKTITIQSTEFILTGILRQELDFVKYKLM